MIPEEVEAYLGWVDQYCDSVGTEVNIDVIIAPSIQTVCRS